MSDRIVQRAGNQSTLVLVEPYQFDFDAGDLLVDGVAVDTSLTGTISVLIDGGGVEIADSVKVPFGPLPVACTVTAAHARADQSGAIVVDVWADDDWIPTNDDSITASAPITITATGDESSDTTLTGWRTALLAGEHLIFNVDSCTTITWCLISLSVVRGVS